VREAASQRHPVTVLYAASVEPPYVAGEGTYIHELLELAGGRNVFGDLDARWSQVSLEEVLRRRPELLIFAVRGSRDETLRRLRGLPGWRDLDAVRRGSVQVVDPDLFSRWGPRLGVVAERLAELVAGGGAGPPEPLP
jgi:iron complex transport system substrate-binding protein